MNVQCGSCPAKYAVPDDKVLGRKVRITCKRCGAAIVVDGTGPGGAKTSQPAPASRAPAPAASTPKGAATKSSLGAAPRAAAGPIGGTAAAGTRPSAAARSALKQTMMGVAPPAPGSSAPAPVPPAAGSANPALAAVNKAPAAGSANAAAAAAPGTGAAFPRSADRDIKRTMIGGLNAPAALDNRPTPAANQPAVAVPRVQPAASDTTLWTVAVTDDQHEEMPIPRIVELFAAGTINVETYIWKQGMDDWQMPFDIPEIAQALRKRGLDPKAKAGGPGESETARQAEKMPTAPPPAGMTPAGVWREPGSWNDGVAWKEPALAPGQEHHDVSFDDVTVALAAPQAEALLRDAELAAALDKDDNDDKDEPTAIFPGGPEAPPLSAPRPVIAAPRPAAGRPAAPRPDPKPSSDAAGLAGHPTPSAIAIETKPLTAPVIAIDAAPASATPASRRATPVERAPDLFADAHRAGSEESQQHDDGASGQKLIGERNESSVLFSLDKVVETEQKQLDKTREEELLGLPTAPPPADPRPEAAPSAMSAADEAAVDGALAGPDFSAPVVEKTAPMPDVEPALPPAAAAPPPAAYPAPAPVAQAAPAFEDEPKPEGGSGWLWAVLLLLLIGAAGAILIFYLRPAAIFGPAPAPAETASAALPVPPPPTQIEPAASAPVPDPSTGAAPAESSAPSTSASAEAQPAAQPKERAEPRRPRDEGSRPIRRERDRKPQDEPSGEPTATEEPKPPVTPPPTEREEGPRP